MKKNINSEEKSDNVKKNIQQSFKYLAYAHFFMGTVVVVADALMLANDNFKDSSLYASLFLLTGMHCFFAHRTTNWKALRMSSLISTANMTHLGACLIWEPTPAGLSVAVNSLIFSGTLSIA